MENINSKLLMGKWSLFVSLLLLAISCADDYGKSDIGGTAIDQTFEASIEAPTDSACTKTLLGGQSGDSNRSVLWQQGDEVYVTTGSTSAKFINTDTSDSKKAILEGRIADAGTYYALYPYSMASGYASGKFNVRLPAQQKYYADGIESGSFPMVAQYSNGIFNFRNLCGILVLNLVGDVEVTSITFSGKDLSGNPIKVAGAGTVSTSYSSTPSLVMSSSAATSVTLDCTNQYTGRGVTLSQSTATPFHMVLPAGTYSTFNLSISTKTGKQMKVNSSKAMTINRSQRTTTSKLTYTEKVEPEYVDLGLSVKWATCNVGASKPEDYGDYFAWGETEPKSNYSWSTYKYCKGSSETLTKYCYDSSYGYNGFTDNKTVLDPSDDVAHVKWGGNWRMPTYDEWSELLNSNNCTWSWTTQNGVKGYKVTGKNGYKDNFIFLPAAGYRDYDSLDLVGSYGDYWSSSLNESGPDGALNVVVFFWGSYNRSYGSRSYGQSVRPVCPSPNFVSVTGVALSNTSVTLGVGESVTLLATITPSNATNKSVNWFSNNTSVATVDASGNVKTEKAGTASITVTTVDGGYTANCSVTVTSGSGSTHEYVDLGLSVKWATCNVGASKPEDYGDYFAWGETTPKSDYSWPTYKYSNYAFCYLTKYCNDSNYGYNGFTDTKTFLDPEDDAAYVNWGCSWRMPTRAEQDELRNSSNCTWTWYDESGNTEFGGIAGYKVTSRKSGYEGNYIFLPATGYRDGTSLYDVGSHTLYWSSLLRTDNPSCAYCLEFDSSAYGTGYTGRSQGFSVRPVCP